MPSRWLAPMCRMPCVTRCGWCLGAEFSSWEGVAALTHIRSKVMRSGHRIVESLYGLYRSRMDRSRALRPCTVPCLRNGYELTRQSGGSPTSLAMALPGTVLRAQGGAKGCRSCDTMRLATDSPRMWQNVWLIMH